MGLFLLKIVKSHAGRDTIFDWSNTYTLFSKLNQGDAELRSDCNKVVEAEKVAHLENVHFLRWTLKQQPMFVGDGVQKLPMCEELEGVGGRELTSEMVPDNVCLKVVRSAALGRKGAMFYRGCLQFSDFEGGENHNFELTTRSLFVSGGIGSDTLIEKLSAPFPSLDEDDEPNTYFCMPNDDNSADPVRRVIAHTVRGIAFKQVENSVRSAIEELNDGGAREIRRLTTEIKRILKGGPFAAASAGNKQSIVSMALKIKNILLAMSPDKAGRITLDVVLDTIPDVF